MLRCAIERGQKKYASISDCFGHHHLDTVHQVMGVDAPRTVVAAGGRFILKDDGEMALACHSDETPTPVTSAPSPLPSFGGKRRLTSLRTRRVDD